MIKPIHQYQIAISSIHEKQQERFFGTKIIFVIKGAATIWMDAQQLDLQTDDLLVVNRGVDHTISGSKDSQVIVLKIVGNFFLSKYPQYFQFNFECFSREIDFGKEKAIEELRRYLAEMVIAELSNHENFKLEIESNLYQVMLLLTRFFKKPIVNQIENEVPDERILKVIQEIEANYYEPLTLNEMAQKVYFSPSYLSRYFKKGTGVGFVQFVNQMRLRHSIEDLIYSDMEINQVALQNGFSSGKNFSHCFKEYYHVTPTDYRLKNQVTRKNDDNLEDQESSPLELTEVLLLLANYCDNFEQSSHATSNSVANLSIDVERESAAKELPYASYIVFIGELKELLKKHVQQQVKQAKTDFRITYIGVKNLLSENTILTTIETDEIVPSYSPYDSADLVLDFIYQENLSLFVYLSYHEMEENQGDYLLKLKAFIAHAIQRYGREFVNRWRFMYYHKEWDNTVAKHHEMYYLNVVALLKGMVPSVKIGTFLPFSDKTETIPASQQWQITKQHEIDFIAFHANQNEGIDFEQTNEVIFNTAQNYLIKKTSSFKKFLASHHMKQPITLIDWNTLTGETRFTNGTFFRGALIMQAIFDLSYEVEGLGFWINTESHEKNQHSQSINIEGMELFHFFNGKRPVYHALAFKERLKGTLIGQGVNYLLTENCDGYQLVLINCNPFNPRLSVEDFFIQRRRKEYYVQIKGLKEGIYQVKRLKFDREHGALYSKYGEFNSQYGVDHEMMDYILRNSEPVLSVGDEEIASQWSFYEYLDFNAIHFIELKKVSKE